MVIRAQIDDEINGLVALFPFHALKKIEPLVEIEPCNILINTFALQ
jgi:hypothetical protein